MADYTPLRGRAFVHTVRDGCKTRNLDELAVFANALHEGIEGHIGEDGTVYGPWQVPPPAQFFPTNPREGPLPHYDQDVQDWAWAVEGIGFVLGQLADNGARGLKGAKATREIGQILNGGGLSAEELKDRVATFHNLRARGDGVWAYLRALADGPTAPAAPAPVAKPAPPPIVPRKSNHAWQALLHVYARTAPRRCQDVIRIANRLPRRHGSRHPAGRSLASTGSGVTDVVVTLDDVEEFNE